MKKQVNPPKPITLLAFFSFVVFAGSMFLIVPVIFAISSVVASAIELRMSTNLVTGDFGSVVWGNALWNFAIWPFNHWIVASIIVIGCTVLFVWFTRTVNKR